MPKSSAYANDIQKLIFNGTALPGAYGANYFIALHTGDPGVGGSQSTNESTLPSYARQSLSKDTSGFTVTGGTASNAVAIVFPALTNGETVTYTHFSLGTASTGAGRILHSYTIKNALNQDVSVTLNEFGVFRIEVGELQITEA